MNTLEQIKELSETINVNLYIGSTDLLEMEFELGEFFHKPCLIGKLVSLIYIHWNDTNMWHSPTYETYPDFYDDYKDVIDAHSIRENKLTNLDLEIINKYFKK